MPQRAYDLLQKEWSAPAQSSVIGPIIVSSIVYPCGDTKGSLHMCLNAVASLHICLGHRATDFQLSTTSALPFAMSTAL